MPDISAAHVLEFCRGVAPGPILLVRVQPQPGCEPRNCTANAERIARLYGGTTVEGWLISEWPGVYINAMDHDVWRRPDGMLVDPTPHSMGFTTIAFLHDPSVRSLNARVTISHPLCPAPLVQRYLDAIELLRRESARTGTRPRRLVRRAQTLHERLVAAYGPEPRLPSPSDFSRSG